MAATRFGRATSAQPSTWPTASTVEESYPSRSTKRPLADAFQEHENALVEQPCCFFVEVAETAVCEEVTVAWIEKELGVLDLLDELAGGDEVLLDPAIGATFFATADRIRDVLAAVGVVLEDTRNGVRWKRK